MDNSTLLRLFMICLGIPLTRASSSAFKPKASALILSDTTNSAPIVQLKERGILVESVPGENLVPGIDTLTLEKLEEFINKEQYNEVIKLADGMDKDEFLRYLCQVVTTLDQFKGLYAYLEQRNMVPDFLAHGEMVLVRKVIFETDLLETNKLGECDSIYDAIFLSLNEDRHDRVAGLFETAHERPAWKNEFGMFVEGFFIIYPPEKDSMPLKRFLTFHGEEFGKKHRATFATICQALVMELRYQLDNLVSQKLLVDLVGQPSLLTPVAYVWGFLYGVSDGHRAYFIKYGYKEALEEGLKEEYYEGGRKLWEAIVGKYPNQFSGAYPSTDEARSIALKDLPTKRDREEQWIVNNASNPRTKLRARQLAEYLYELDITFPTVLWIIVAEYATVPSWLDTE